jgi:dihydrofolate reductase
VMVIGGAEIYRHALEIADRVYLTRIDVAVENGDAHFPVLEENEWQLVSDLPGDSDANFQHKFLVYERI